MFDKVNAVGWRLPVDAKHACNNVRSTTMRCRDSPERVICTRGLNRRYPVPTRLTQTGFGDFPKKAFAFHF